MTSPLPYFVYPEGFAGPNSYRALASDLGFAPGVWPEEIPCNVGNGNPLVFYHFTPYGDRECFGPEGGRMYLQVDGDLTLHVYTSRA